jgi:PaREP1/PaREP8 domain containing family protein
MTRLSVIISIIFSINKLIKRIRCKTVCGSIMINIPDELYEVLIEVAKRLGTSVEVIIIKSLIEKLDPRERVEVYTKLHGKYLKEAEELAARGDIA